MSQINLNTIIEALHKHKNILLYGPPGTGKTWLLANTLEQLKNNAITLNTTDQQQVFNQKQLADNLHIEWVTFHQSYSYEDFIIGKRPIPINNGIELKPFLGLLMTMALKVEQDDGTEACLLVIDELNRANVSQVFGEFITLLDLGYRKTINNNPNPHALNIRLPGVTYQNDETEQITILDEGIVVKIPKNWSFPEHFYIIATMNSIDKAAMPLDAALERRFHKIEILPSIETLAQNLVTDLTQLNSKFKAISNGTASANDLSAEEATLLIFDRVNAIISEKLDNDFMLGHAIYWGVVQSQQNQRWEALISTWDHKILPTILNRAQGNPYLLREILKIDEQSSPSEHYTKNNYFGRNDGENISIKLLSSINHDKAKEILQSLAV